MVDFETGFRLYLVLFFVKSYFLFDILIRFLMLALFVYVFSAVPTIIIAHEFYDALPIHQFQVWLHQQFHLLMFCDTNRLNIVHAFH